MTATDNRHPTGFWFIFWGEFAERASFYGMKAILVLYMINKLGYSDGDSSQIASFFTAFCYILPIAGGYIADRWLGKFKTIIYFAIPYILGHIILGTFDTRVGLFVALLLLAGGSGSIKPNISTLMGLMYEKAGKKHLLSQAFSWFYMAINIGAASTMFSLPFIRDRYGYSVAFMAPTILMVISLGIFYIGRKYYPQENIKEMREDHKRPKFRDEDRKIIWKILGLFSLIVFFWSIFDQSYSTWTLFARDYMLLQTPWGFRIPPDSLQTLNPFLIIFLSPFFVWLWSKTDKSETIRVSSPKKMLIGFVLVIFCMGVMTIAGFIGVNHKISILWEVFAYFFVTAAELCISIVGLQLAYEEAPAHLKSLVTGYWLATITVGDILAGFFARIYTDVLPPGPYFGLMTIMIAIVTIGFYFVGRKFEKESAEPDLTREKFKSAN